MGSFNHRSPSRGRMVRLVAGLSLLALLLGGTLSAQKSGTIPAQKPAVDAKTAFPSTVQPLLKKYCLDCHSTTRKKGSLDLERFTSLEDIRKDLKPWQQLIEQIEAREMPPREKPQPSEQERQLLLAWTRQMLDAEARARAGDPGHVPLRRLSNAEYDCTIRDLTGVDLRPTRQFPADGAAGEGFTNAAEALTDISPTLLNKYLNAAKEIADHAVLLPDGFRFSPGKTRRDWTDEMTERLRQFYARHTAGEGRLPVQPYLSATIRHRTALRAGTVTPEAVAARENLNPKYLAILWKALTDKTPSYPLDGIRARWDKASEKDVPALAAEIAGWQASLWKTVRVGSYMHPVGQGYAVSTARQLPSDPPAAEVVPLRVAVKPAPGQAEVVLSLTAQDLASVQGQEVIWHRPRFEGAGKPSLLLRDYHRFAATFEVDYPSLLANSSRYLAAVIEAANERKATVDGLAQKHQLDATLLKRWIEILAVEPLRKTEAPKTVAALPLELLQEKTARTDNRPAVNGWRKKGTDLPVVVTNASDRVEHIPGRLPARSVAVHPTPTEFVAVAWKSPLSGEVQLGARITHAHPTCGNGVAWWLEHRRAGRATLLEEGTLDLGKEARLPARAVKVEIDDVIVLAVDARENNHSCDLTEIAITLTETSKPKRVWDLAADVASKILDGNPHADSHGNRDTWSFVRGVSKGKGPASASLIPPDSILGQWRKAAADPARQGEVAKLASQVETLLSGSRPGQGANRLLYDRLVAIESPLFTGVNVARLAKTQPKKTPYGLAPERFGTRPGGKAVDEASLVVPTAAVVEMRLPAALFVGREFVVEGRLEGASARVVQFRVQATAPGAEIRVTQGGSVLASPNSPGYRRLLEGYADFRRLFPLFLCFPRVVPNDEVVSLKMFHREDEPLIQLFLNTDQQRQLERLWTEHRFISRQPVAENAYLPLFIGFVTQDQPKSMVTFFEGQRPAFQKRADAFLKEEAAAIAQQLDALLEFAGKAYRRPLLETEKKDLRNLYQAVRARGAGHEEAFRGVLVRILMAPAFLFRVEHAPVQKEAGPVNDWELATRLSYFLWSSMPDAELRQLAAAGKLHDPQVLAAQTQRMLQDARLRAFAIEFGTQWIHVRGFDGFNEKNEKLFPTFNAELRTALYEEAIRFFQDLFQTDRAVTQILDADYTFLNETLARHYGIPGVKGSEWRRLEGVRKYGRGGVLGLGSVQAKQAGASRSSPVLRGNWVVETLLGEKLPRPPADVPRLPEEEGTGGLTMRQQVEKHAKVASCAACHVRIDPFGFALEKYDAIGRLRAKDLGGLALDTRVKLRDGSEFDGIEGLRTYLLTRKKDVVVRLFCRRLLGYALGRAVALSDEPLLDDMVRALHTHEGKVSAAVQTIVKSPQFRMVRGSEFGN